MNRGVLNHVNHLHRCLCYLLHHLPPFELGLLVPRFETKAAVSLGQGQGPKAEFAINEGKTGGTKTGTAEEQEVCVLFAPLRTMTRQKERRCLNESCE